MYVSSNVMSCLKSDKAKVFCTSLLVGHLNYYPGGNSDLLLPVLSSSATFKNLKDAEEKNMKFWV